MSREAFRAAPEQKPLVTVVVCAYRQVAHLEVALKSALGQTYPAFELVVADDSDSADIRRLCEVLADARIRYRPRRPSLGIAVNHWRAFAEADTPFVAVLNHDDVWEPEFLEELVDALETNPFSSLAFCDHWLIDEDGQPLVEATQANSRRYGRSMLVGGEQADAVELAVSNTVPLAMGSVFRRLALDLDTFDPQVGGAYDLWTTYCLSRGARFSYVPRRLTRYRVHPESATARLRRSNLEGALYVVDKQLQDALCRAHRPVLVRKKAGLLRSLAADKVALGLHREAKRDLVASLRASPSLRSAIRLVTPPYR